MKIQPITHNRKIQPILSKHDARSIKTNLSAPDGKEFGKVSVSAYNAVRGGYLDNYYPVDEKEKSILDEYVQYTSAKNETQKGETAKTDEFYDSMKKIKRAEELPPITEINTSWKEAASNLFKGISSEAASDILKSLSPKEGILRKTSNAENWEAVYNTAPGKKTWDDRYLKAEYYTKSIPKLDDFAEKSKTDKSLANSDMIYAAVSGNEEAIFRSGKRISAMTSAEKGVYKYLYATKGKKEANAYLDILNDELTTRTNKEKLNKTEKNSAEHPVLSSIGTMARAPLTGISGWGALTEDAARALTGRPINVYSDLHQQGNKTQTTRQTVDKEHASKAFGEATLPVIGNVGSFLYNTGMSMGDNVVNMITAQGIAGVGTSAGLISPQKASNAVSAMVTGMMSGSSAAQGVVAAKQKGLSDVQAVTEGFAQGLTEALTEKYSIDKILEKKSIPALLQSFVSEGSEEMVSEIANAFTDYLIAGDQSDWSESIKEYLNNGYPEEEAIKRTIADLSVQTLAAGIGGAFSGLGLGVGHNTVGHAVNTVNKTGTIKNIDSEITSTQKYISNLDERMKNDVSNKREYVSQKNAAQDYINDLNLYKENLKSKKPTAEANLKTAERFETLKEFNPNYYDTQSGQYVRIDADTDGKYTVKMFDGSYVTKTREQVEQRFLETKSNDFLRKDLNRLMSKENGDENSSATKEFLEKNLNGPTSNINENISFINEGDVFVDRNNGNRVTVAAHDDDGTVISVDNGKTVMKSTISNTAADELVNDERFTKKSSAVTADDLIENANGRIYINQPNAEYNNSAPKTGEFKILGANGNIETRNGYMIGKFGVSRSGGEYIVSYLPTGTVVETFGDDKTALEFAGNMNAVYIGDEHLIRDDSGMLRASTANGSVNDTVVADADDNSDVAYMENLGLTYDEQSAILNYKSSGSYILNDSLRKGGQLSEEELLLKDAVNNALEKFPKYSGIVYRNIGFYEKDMFDDFIAEHQNGSVVYNAFTSVSKSADGYIVDTPFQIHYEIESSSGRDISKIGIAEEEEVLFKSGTSFDILDIEVGKNTVKLKIKENDENAQTTEFRRTLENEGERQDNAEAVTGNEYAGNNGDVRQTSDTVRGRSAIYDKLSETVPESDQGRNKSGSEQDNERGITESGLASVSEGHSNRISEADRKRLQDVYRRMKDRCYNSNAKDYKYYGGKGVSIDGAWLKDFDTFFNWALQSGYKEGLTIDRIDPNGNYEPENCRWATMAEQNRNKSEKKNAVESTEPITDAEETSEDTPFNLTDKCTLTQTKHTATGDDIWVVSLNDKISKEEFADLRNAVKPLGGYYSKFAKTPDGKAIPGFIFKSEPTAKELTVFNDFFGYTEETTPAETKSGIKEIDVVSLLGAVGNAKVGDEIKLSDYEKQTSDEQSLKNETESDIINKNPTTQIDEYIKGKTQLQKNSILKALNTSFKTNEYGSVSFAEFIERSVADGRTINERKHLKSKLIQGKNNFNFGRDVDKSFRVNSAKYHSAGINNSDFIKEARELFRTKQGGNHIKAIDPELYYYITGDESALPESAYTKTYDVGLENGLCYDINKTAYDYGKWLEENESEVKDNGIDARTDTSEDDKRYNEMQAEKQTGEVSQRGNSTSDRGRRVSQAQQRSDRRVERGTFENESGEINNVTDTSGSSFENDERYSKMQTSGKSETVQDRRADGLHPESDERDDRSGNRSISAGTEKSETRTLDEIAENDDFINISRFVGNEISYDIYTKLKQYHENDTRLTDDGFDFADVITYDMLTDKNNSLRELFADNIAEYFNTEIDVSTDITGAKVSADILKATQNSVVKNEAGQLIPVYHGTGAEFDNFARSDIGIHFGSYAQAAQRTADKGLENPRYIKAYLNIENPLYIAEDFYGWNAPQTVQSLAKRGILTADEAEKYIKESRSGSNDELTDLLKEKGFDGIVYNNEIEAANGKSYIVFDNEQIIKLDRSADNNDTPQSEILAGESVSDGRRLRTGAGGTDVETGTEKADAEHRNAGGEILPTADGNGGSRPDVGNDSERVHGRHDAENTAKETERTHDGTGEQGERSGNGGVSEISDGNPEIIETEVKTVERKRPSNKNNFVITNDIAAEIDNTSPSAEDNIEAIELLVSLENEGRAATAEEKKILAKYKGWGGIDIRQMPWRLSERFDELFDDSTRNAMYSSMNNAFFTPTKVIDAIYSGLKQMGFKGGNVLETSMGTGNFFGRMPSMISAKSALTGIELETYTAKIAQYLYPGATVINKAYQDVAIKNGSYDLVIGNVPFGQNKISYGGKKYSMHNYFIISSLDKLKDGGIAAVLTSSGTLDSYGTDARKAIMDRADVVACYKLPEKVFSKNANTDVQTDLLILRKRANGERPKGGSILNVTTTADGLKINEYFAARPGNILGTLKKGTNAWGEITTVADDGNFYEKLNTAMSKLPKNLISGKTELKPVETLISFSDKPKFFEKNGKIYADDGAGTATEVSKNQVNTVRDYMVLRDAYKEMLNAYENDLTEEEIQPLRKKLSDVYDDFYQKHGAVTGDGKKKINGEKSKNNTFLEADTDYYLVGGLEQYDPKSKTFSKSALFDKDTLRKKKITSADTASDALAVSLNESGRIDFKRMQELTGKTEKQLAEELNGEVVFTPDGDYVLTDIYLSGNIYEKIDAAKGKKGFEKQLEMLEKVKPVPKKASDISVKLGANYIDPSYVERFAKEVFGTSLTVKKDISGAWVIEGIRQSRYGDILNTKYGCKAFNAVQLLEKILNDGEITATKKIGSGSMSVRVFDAEMTEIAKQKADDIREAFSDWIFKDTARRNDIVNKYNRTYNHYRPLDYGRIAEKLSFDSMDNTLKAKLYPHQKKGIARFLFGGNTLFAHGVGTGKTFEMIASVMEARRMGIVNKAAMVVPNNKVVDFKRDIAQAYPSAKVLVIDTANKKRQAMLGLVNSNDWDIILIAKTTFTKIPVSPKLQANYISEQLENLDRQIAEAKHDRNVSKRQLKSLTDRRTNLEQKMNDLNSETSRDETSIDFEKLGIDCICVDEAHNYKSLITPSKLNIKGLVGKKDAQTANDMLMKLDYIRSINGKIIFGTGTPITNTVSEIYNMMRMVRPEILEDAGIHSLDEWVNTFAKIDNVTEIGIDNQIKQKSTQVIRSFVNTSEMVGMFRQFADIVFTEDVVKNLPKAVYKEIKIAGTKEHKKIQAHIAKTLASAKKSDILSLNGQLMAMADAAAADLRMLSNADSDVNPFKDYSLDELEYADSKINTMCNYVYDEYKQSENIKGTQIIFCDKGAGAGKVYSLNLHKDIMHKLVERGIPKDEIVIVKNQSDAQLEELYEKVNSGEVRVIIGTSAKMAEGLNVQERVVAIHHPTVTYKPSDWEQSNARGVRAGNINDEVRIYRYLQENTFDSHKWQAQDRKGEMIKKALRGEVVEELEDIGADDEGGEDIDAATAMAITSGNPLVKEKIDIDKEVNRLKTLHRNYMNEIYRYQDVIAQNPELIRQYALRAENLKHDIAVRNKYSENPVMHIAGRNFNKQTDANKALSNAVKSAPKNGKYVKVGIYNGFDILFKGDMFGTDYSMVLKGDNEYSVEYSGSGNNMARFSGVLKRMDSDLTNISNKIETLKSDLEFAKREINKPFEKENDLKEAVAKQKDVTYRYEHYSDRDVPKTETAVHSSRDGDDVVVNSNYMQNAENDTDVFAPNPDEMRHYSAQVDEWLNGDMKSSDVFELGRTPAVLRELNAGDLPIVMTKDVMHKITGGKHDIAIDEIKRIPEAIADPIMIFNSATVDNAFVILTELADKQGNDIVVAMHLNKYHNENRINRVASVYGKENIGNFVEKQINDGNLKYIDNNKSQVWSIRRGLQLPKLNTILDSDNSILQKEDIVNGYSAQKSHKDTGNGDADRWNTERTKVEQIKAGETKIEKAKEKAGEIANKAKEKAAPIVDKAVDTVNKARGIDIEKTDTVRLDEIVDKIRDKFGITIATGKVTNRKASGIYKDTPEVIRTRVANNLPTILHELGHHLDKTYDLNRLESISKLRQNVSQELLEEYPEEERNGEAVAEFVRTYLKNVTEANRLCPEFYNEFVQTVSKQDLKSLNEIASSANEYFSYEKSKRYGASIVSSKQKNQKTLEERRKEFYTDWVDRFHPIKSVMDYVEERTGDTYSGKNNAYVLAMNSLNAHVTSNYLVREGFRDLDGNRINAKSFVDCISSVNSKDINTLDEYLMLRHSLEWIEPKHEDVAKKRVFAEKDMEDVTDIKKLISDIERKHPEMKTAAENLYEYQNNVLQHFAVQSGLMTEDLFNTLKEKYPDYVPFYRAVGKKSGQAKSTFMNQRSPIMRAKGSGELIISPLESIIRTTEKIVKSSLRNQTAEALASYSDNIDGFGRFMERVPPDMIPFSMNISNQKEHFLQELRNVENSDDAYFAASDLLDEIFDDVITGFTPKANAGKKIVTVMRNGRPVYYQIHDDLLYKSVAELSPQQTKSILDISAFIMRPMKNLITQYNYLFGTSNPMRDFRTAYRHSEIINPAEFTQLYIKALEDILNNSEMYQQYKAMGGGHSSVLSADMRRISQTLRDVAMKDKGKANRLAYAIFRHPINTCANLNDLTESIPRFMEFQRTLKSGGDLQQALFNSEQITDNFKRAGIKGQKANKVFMFFNAAVQGVDNLLRTLTDKDPEKRRNALIKFALCALFNAIIEHIYNEAVDEEGYKNLSSYKKNNFYNYAIGNGNFISIPKPRENAILDSLTERTIEYLADGNENAYYGFLGYVFGQLLPPGIPNTANPKNWLHSSAGSTVFGGLLDIAANRDFKGTPIESDYYKSLPSNERYSDNTSWVAYTLGQTRAARAAEISPLQIDHLLSSFFGIAARANTALAPKNASRRDFSVGLRNKFISDSNYSTDVLNRLYENRDKAEKAFEYYGTADSAVEYEQNAVVTSYISGMNKAIRALPDENQRAGRAFLLKSLNVWDYNNTAAQDKMLKYLDGEDISDKCIITSVPKSSLEWSENGYRYSYQMTPQEYNVYVKEYLTLADRYRVNMSRYGANTEKYKSALEKTDSEVKSKLNEKYKRKYRHKADKVRK